MSDTADLPIPESTAPRLHPPVQRFHGAEPPRGLQEVPRSTLYEGYFGRLFRNLNPLEPELTDLAALARRMVEPATAEGEDENESGDNPAIAAGFTYLGQFIDHDITFDPTSKLQRQNDPDALRNFRTPRYDLDSLYGSGPDDQPYLYQADGLRLLVGQNDKNGTLEDDLPRTAPGGADPRRALIGDPRNDENVIVSQLQLAFIKFHNAVVSDLEGGGIPRDRLLEEARREVRWHYQWLVIHDFLRRVVGQPVLDDVLGADEFIVDVAAGPQTIRRPKASLQFFHWRNQPYMPVEFSVAAYRFGHTIIRPDYTLNQLVREVPIFSDQPNPGEFDDLRGFRERPAQWEIEWRRFFEFPETVDGELQVTRKIDTHLSHGLGFLPQDPNNPIRSLAERNLKRGRALGLPAGQAVARAMSLPPDLILAPNQLGLSLHLRNVFGTATPLWYYILREAEILARGIQLGPVGGRIVAEVFVGLLDGDPLSYLSVEPAWQPAPGRFGAGPNGEFGIAELLRFAGVTI